MASESSETATAAFGEGDAVDYSQLAQEVLRLMPAFRHPPHPEGGDPRGCGPRDARFGAHAHGHGSLHDHLHKSIHDRAHGSLHGHGAPHGHPPFPADLRDASRGAPIVLALLSREGGSATPSRLCELSGLSKGRVSNIVSSLDSKGYVQKQPSPEDARSVTVTLTPKGRAFTDTHEQVMCNHVAAILEKLGPQDARDAVRILKHLAAIMAGTSHNADAAPAPVDSATEGGTR